MGCLPLAVLALRPALPYLFVAADEKPDPVLELDEPFVGGIGGPQVVKEKES